VKYEYAELSKNYRFDTSKKPILKSKNENIGIAGIMSIFSVY